MKAMSLIAFLCLLLSQSQAQRKSFTVVYSNADSLGMDGKYFQELNEREKVLETHPHKINNIANYASTLSKLGEIDSAFTYLSLCLERDTVDHVNTNPLMLCQQDYFYLCEDPRWSLIQDTIVNRLNRKGIHFKNETYARELWNLKIKDQAFYNELKLLDKDKGHDQALMRVIWTLKNRLNLENLAALELLIEEFGWPKISEVGSAAAGSAFFVIQHTLDKEVQKKYLPIIKEAALQKEASLQNYAYLEDRVRIRDGEQQLYGSQYLVNEDGEYDMDRLFEPEYVDQRRSEMNLGPLSQYLKRHFDCAWNIVQKEK